MKFIWKALTIFNTLFILVSFVIGFLDAIKREKLAHQITFKDPFGKPRVDKYTMRMMQKKEAIPMDELEKIRDKDVKKTTKKHLTLKERFNRFRNDFSVE